MESWSPVHFYFWFSTRLTGTWWFRFWRGSESCLGGCESQNNVSTAEPADTFSSWDVVLHLQHRLSITAERFPTWNPPCLKVWLLLQFVIHLSPLWAVNRTNSEASSQSGSFLMLQLECVNVSNPESKLWLINIKWHYFPPLIIL